MPIYETTVEAAFSASHSVRMPSGAMEPAHTHTWRISAAFRAGELNADGFVVDFLAVLDGLHAVTRKLEGQDLNAVLAGEGAKAAATAGASAERVAEYIARRLHEVLSCRVYSLRVSEAAGCWATYYPDERTA